MPAAAALTDGASNPTTPMVGAALEHFNGSTWERVRSANGADATTGLGILSSGLMGFDGTNWHRIKSDSTGLLSASISGTATVDTEMPAAAGLADATANPTTPLVGSANEVFNGTTWDRARSATNATGTSGTGLLGAGVLGYDTVNA